VVLTQPFYVGSHEVMQAQFERIMGHNPSRFALTGESKDEAIAGLNTERFPVEKVSWNSAAEFCAKLSEHDKLKPVSVRNEGTLTIIEGEGYRLPTEAQWEFACRAGTITRYWTGDSEESLVQAGWFGSNAGKRTHAAGELAANPLGLFDVHGNVLEWVMDRWDPVGYAQFGQVAAVDPMHARSPDGRYVCRGGLFNAYASRARSAHRQAFHPDAIPHLTGLRVALPVDAVKNLMHARSSDAND
jgi:formylglycine-generating enzyme required for sulfatase activity